MELGHSRPWEYFLAALFIVLGVLFLLHSLGVANIGKWWPLILIAIGLAIIWGRFRRSRPGTGTGVFHRWLGDIRLGEGGWEFEDTTMESGLGNVRIDLTKASIRPGAHSLNVYSWMGKIEILVPANLALSAGGAVTLGSVAILDSKRDGFFPELTLTSPDYDAAETKLAIKMQLFIGDVSLRRTG
jgi:lia operon protein LiaF